MSDTVYTTKMINLTDLIPYEKNAKLHPQEQIDKLAKEISEVGWTQPIVVDCNNVIVVGHGRRLAAIQLGIDLVPVHQLSKDVDPERVRAMRLFDNKVSETGYDEALLKSELVELAEFGFNFEFTGYSEIPNVNEFQPNLPNESENIDIPTASFVLRITFESEEEQQDLFIELRDRGFKVKV